MESLCLRLVHSAEVSHETSNGWVHPGLYVADKLHVILQIISALYTKHTDHRAK